MSRFDEALAIFERARQIDPLSPEIHRGIAHVHFAARRMDQAIEQSLKLLDLDPNYAGASWVLARAYEAKGMYDAAARVQQLRPNPAGNAAFTAEVACGLKGTRRAPRPHIIRAPRIRPGLTHKGGQV